MYETVEEKMREIISRRWTTDEYLTLEDLHPNIYTSEIYDELIESGIDIPKGLIERILKAWMAQGYIRTTGVGGNAKGKGLHGNMKIAQVYDSFIKGH
jgi:hypothetical protein